MEKRTLTIIPVRGIRIQSEVTKGSRSKKKNLMALEKYEQWKINKKKAGIGRENTYDNAGGGNQNSIRSYKTMQ